MYKYLLSAKAHDVFTRMYSEMTLTALENSTHGSILLARQTPQLRSSGHDGWRGAVRRYRGLSKIKNQSSEKRSTKDHTLSRFAFGALNGVPSRFSALFFPGWKISSRRGRTFKSAYFLQFVPQVSQRRSVARPLGARHQVSDSRVRQAPQLVFALVGPRMVEPSSSDMCTSTVGSVSSVSLTTAARSRVRICSSFSMELASSVKKNRSAP